MTVVPAIDFSRWDVAALGESWRQARPFAHVVLDDLVPSDALDGLRRAVAEEPHWPNRGEIYDMMASALPTAHPTLRSFEGALGGADGLAAVRAITGKAVERIEMRSYVYLAGQYLLPHSDCRTGMGRLVAYTFYLWQGPMEGGELELFACDMDGGLVVATRPALTITPRANRLVLFDVTPATLHQIREVRSGARLSLSGWFYA
jgi:hypothetical protein